MTGNGCRKSGSVCVFKELAGDLPWAVLAPGKPCGELQNIIRLLKNGWWAEQGSNL